MTVRILCLIVIAVVVVHARAARAEPVHGIAMHGAPALPKGFSHFPYVNPSAPKGGRLTLGASGSFDSLNPLIVKGDVANGVREFVFESLMARSLDEPFSLYGLIAESVETPEDRSSVTFRLDPRARFSDGAAITAADVLFSYEVLREKGRPNHRTYYKKVTKAEQLSKHEVRFTFESGDREMPLILGLMPVLPSHVFKAETFEATTLNPAAMIGSGPYKIAHADAGRSVAYARDPNYWGRHLPVNAGRFNFDEIRFEYFREGAALFEAFKSGQLGLRSEEDPGRWHEGYNIPAVADGRVAKREFEIGLPAGMTALAFNTRRAIFADPRVRRALILMFDFEWVNRGLYHGLFRRTQSYFERSVLSSNGRPADARERELLAPFPEAVKPSILDGSHFFPATGGDGHNRANWQAAAALLREAGYELDGARLVHKETKTPLEFEILTSGAAQERVFSSYIADLNRLGVRAALRTTHSAQFERRRKTYDFDMMPWSWGASLSPGNEQLFRWSSSSATEDGTFNLPGVQNPAVDALIAAMLAATTHEEFVSAVRALDRVLLSGDYVIPLYYLPTQWVAHWKTLAFPETTPVSGFNLDSWWSVEAGTP